MGEIDVKEFGFRQMCRLQIGGEIQNQEEEINHLAVSNKHGLIFSVADASDLLVVTVDSLEYIVSSGDVNVNETVTNFPSTRLRLGVQIMYIALNTDETILVVAYKTPSNDTLTLGLIDVRILEDQDKTKPIFAAICLGKTRDLFVRKICCHPEQNNLFAICLSNGSVVNVQLEDTGVLNQVAASKQGDIVKSICWSPKGKQIIFGYKDGSVVQWDKMLSVEKKRTASPNFEDGQGRSVNSIHWLSTYLYIAVYNNLDYREDFPSVVMITTKKDGPASYTMMDDIYYGIAEHRSLCYYFTHLPSWDLMVSMASNATEAAPVGKIEESWNRWALQDVERAECPLTEANEESYPVGCQISLNSKLVIKKDDCELPPAPIFTMLTTAGVLCAYQMINKFSNTKHDILVNPIPLSTGNVRRGTEETIGKLSQPFAKQETLDEKPPTFMLKIVDAAKEKSMDNSYSFGATSQALAPNSTSEATPASKPFTFGASGSLSGSVGGLPSEISNPVQTTKTGGFSFSASQQVSAPELSQKQGLTSTFTSGGLSFGTPQQNVASETKTENFSFGAPKQGVGGFSFGGTTPIISQEQDEAPKPVAGGFSFGGTTPVISQKQDEAPKPVTGGFSFGGTTPVISQKQGEGPKPVAGGFSFGGTTPVISQKQDEAPKPVAGGFSFGGTTPVISQKQSEGPKPVAGGFSFGGTTPVISQKQGEGPKPVAGGFSFDGTTPVISQKQDEAPKPVAGGFSFGGTTPVISQKQDEAPKPVAGGFSFGGTTPVISQKQGEGPKPVAGGFSFDGTTPVISQKQDEAPKPVAGGFSFGGTTPVISQKQDEAPKPVAGGFSFGGTTPVISQKQGEGPKPVAGGFSFGGTTPVISQKQDEAPKPVAGGFSFGGTTPVISQKQDEAPKPVTGGFSFGGTTPVLSQNSFDAPQKRAVSQNPEPATSTKGEGFSFGGTQQPTSEFKPFTPNKTLTASSIETKSQLPVVSISTNPVTVQCRATLAENNPSSSFIAPRTTSLPPPQYQETPKQPTPLLNTYHSDEQEITFQTEKLDSALQNHINEEINSFNEELAAFKISFSSITERKELIGSRSEFDSLCDDVKEISSVINDYKNTMDENKNECTELRHRILSNFKHVDEAILLKEKSEDKRYTEFFRTRKLDPVSAKQRKDLRFQVNNLGNILSDINASLDNKWEELQRQKSKLRQPRSANQSHQIYKTIEAIEKISGNLSNRLKSLTLEAEESYMITMNTTRNASQITKKNPSSSTLSSSKMNRLREMLNKRENTPVRRPKQYSHSDSTFSLDSTSVLPTPHPKLNPKAASTPALNQSFSIPQSQYNSHKMGTVSEETSYAKSAVQKLKDYAPPAFLHQETPKFVPAPQPPEYTPVTPMLPIQNKQSQKFETSDRLPNINKNLFGQKPNQSSFQSSGSEPMQTPPTAFKGFTQESSNVATSKSSFGKLNESSPVQSGFSIPNKTPFGMPRTDTEGVGLEKSKLFQGFGIGSGNKMSSSTSQSAFTSLSNSTNVPSSNSSSSRPFGLVKESSGSTFCTTTTSSEIPFKTKQVLSSTSTIPKLSSSGGLFGESLAATTTTSSGISFGESKTMTGLLLASSNVAASTSGSFFGVPKSSTTTSTTSGGLFGISSTAASSTPGSFFGLPKFSTTTSSTSDDTLSTANSTSGGLFGAPKSLTTTTQGTNGLFAATSITVTSSSSLLGTFTASSATATSSTSGGLFGANTTSLASGGLFGANMTSSTSGGLFGANTTSSTSGGLFGANTTSSASGGLFGTNTSSSTSGGLFGANTTSSASGGLFGVATTSSTSGGLFGANTTSSASGGLFGVATTSSTSGGLFGANTTSSASGGLFGVATISSPSGGLFGTNTTSSASGGLFGVATTSSASGSLFGANTTTSTSGGLFGANTSSSTSGGLFGTSTTSSTSGGLFGASTTTATPASGFASVTTTGSTTSGLFGASTTTTTGGLFGSSSFSGGGLFGAKSETTKSSGSLFGSSTTSTTSAGGGGGGLFGNSSTAQPSGGLFGQSSTQQTSATTTSTGFGSNSSGGFGGGFGLGGKPINDPTKNPFGNTPSASTSSTTSNALFGSAPSAFGMQSTPVQSSGGTFSKGFGAGLGSPPNNNGAGGFGSAASAFGSPQPAAFGGAPSFGSPPAFGAAPAFGSGASFGSGTTFGGNAPSFGASTSTFGSGGGATFGSNSATFGGSAGGGGATFGSLANQSGGNATPFGGAPQQEAAPSFGGLSQQNTGSSGFGSANSPSGSQFSSWR